ncbi:MAG: SGNH/GDSL hydrolase family protein [Pseudomonadota bacterium]
MRYLALVGATALMTTSAQASTIPELFSSFWVLGDSLSDNGNTATMVGTLNAQQSDPIDFPPGSPLQQPGVSSDGFTWARTFTDAFSAAGKANANLSFGAARASDNGNGPPDLAEQIARDRSFTTTFDFTFDPTTPDDDQSISGTVPKYLDGRGGLLDRKGDWGDNPLVTVFIGGNDFLDTAAAIAGGLGTPEDLLPMVVERTLLSMTQNINELVAEGVSDFMVFNLPNFAVIPQFNGDGALLGGALAGVATQYNSLLDTYLDGLRAGGINVTSVDIFSALTDKGLLSAAGIKNADDACVSSVNPATQNCRGFLYFDNIHPTKQGHGIVADIAQNALRETYNLQPIPLPAPALLLVTALGGTFVLRRRRKSPG